LENKSERNLGWEQIKVEKKAKKGKISNERGKENGRRKERIKKEVTETYKAQLRAPCGYNGGSSPLSHATDPMSALHPQYTESKCTVREHAISLDVRKIPKGRQKGRILTQLENWDRNSLRTEEAVPVV